MQLDEVRPVRSVGISEHPLGDELLLFTARTATAHALNAPAAAIWSLADGTRTVSEISAALAGDVGRAPESLLPDVRTGIRELASLGLLDLAGPHSGSDGP